MALCDLPEPAGPAGAAPPHALPEGVPPLRSFYLYLSAGCNLRCRHCWVAPEFSGGRPVPGMMVDPAALRDAVTEAKPLGLVSAKLTGGEPLLHPQFREIVDMLTAEGLSMNMETNGTLLTAPLAQHLREHTNVGFISVSIDYPDPAAHDAFRGMKGAFDAAVRGLDHLVAAGYTNCQVIMSVHRGNLDRLEELVRLAAQHKAGSVKFNPVTRTGRGIAMHERGEALGFHEYLGLFRYVNEQLRPASPLPLIMNIPPALTPFGELWRIGGRTCDCNVSTILGILGTGEIALCGIGQTIPDLVFGRLGRDSIRDIWLSHPVIRQLRSDLENVLGYPGICGSCIHAKSCRTSCVADNWVRNEMLVSPQWLCAEAERLGVFPKSRLRA